MCEHSQLMCVLIIDLAAHRMGLTLDWAAMMPGLTALTTLKLVDCDHLAVSATEQFSQLTALQVCAASPECSICT